VDGGCVAITHAPRDFAGSLQAGLERVLELLLDTASRAKQLFDSKLALAEQIRGRARTSRDCRQQMRARRALLLLLRELISDPFDESEFGFEAGTGHHRTDLPGAEKMANFSSIWPTVQVG